MLCNNNETEILFNKSLLVNIKDGTLCRKIKLSVTIENITVNTPALRKELLVRLTDECDPFFLYSLILTDSDFQSLKNQQDLLVDFSAFPQKFIDLLELCQKEEHNEIPRFLLNLTLSNQSSLDLTPAHFDIVETNPFKHLIHLSLKLFPASDNDIKKYLGTCLKTLKEERDRLETRLRTVEADLQQRLIHTQELLTLRDNEIEKIKTEFKFNLTSKENKYSEELSIERRKLMKLHEEAELKWENQRKELEQNYQLKIHKLENQIDYLDSSNKELQEKVYKNDASNHELRKRVNNLQDDLHQSHQKLLNLSKENTALDSKYQEQSKMLNHFTSKLSLCEQELKSSEENVKKLQEQLINIQEEKRKLEENCDKKQFQISKQSASIKTLSEDLIKGNEIIRKLQAEMHNNHAKLKLRSQISMKQEEVLAEKEDEIKRLKDELNVIKDNLKEKESENLKFASDFEETKQKLEETQKQIKTNENVIKWLNKQLNEKQTTVSQSNINVDPVTTVGTFRQNIYQPKTFPVRPHISVSTGSSNITTTISNYSQGLYGTQRMFDPNLKPHSANNFTTRKNIIGTRNPLPSYYFQRQDDAVPVATSTTSTITKAAEAITTSASKLTTITIEEDSPQSCPPPSCISTQLKTPG